MKKLIIMISIIGFLLIPIWVMAQDEVPASSSEDVAIATEQSAESDQLDGLSVEEPTAIPSSFGIWWRGIREAINITLTFNTVKKAEKRLVFAEERIKLAEYIVAESDDPAIQEKAIRMLEVADKYLQKIEDKKDKILAKTDQRIKRLIDNISKHELNKKKALDFLEEVLPKESGARLNEISEKSRSRIERFMQAIENSNMPKEVKDRARERRVIQEATKEQRREMLEERKVKQEQFREENGEMRGELKQEREEYREEVEEKIEEMKEEKKDAVEAVKDADTKDEKKEAIADLKELNKEQADEKKEIKDNAPKKENKVDDGVMASSSQEIEEQAVESEETEDSSDAMGSDNESTGQGTATSTTIINSAGTSTEASQ